jgi:hypothetical protein
LPPASTDPDQYADQHAVTLGWGTTAVTLAWETAGNERSQTHSYLLIIT